MFGMGTGGSLSLLSPEIDINLFSLLCRLLSPFSYLLAFACLATCFRLLLLVTRFCFHLLASARSNSFSGSVLGSLRLLLSHALSLVTRSLMRSHRPLKTAQDSAFSVSAVTIRFNLNLAIVSLFQNKLSTD